jgi:hypothetical protein
MNTEPGQWAQDYWVYEYRSRICGHTEPGFIKREQRSIKIDPDPRKLDKDL